MAVKRRTKNLRDKTTNVAYIKVLLIISRNSSFIVWLDAVTLPSNAEKQHAMYTVSQQNIPPMTCYNLDTNGSITIIFGTSVNDKVDNQSLLYFPTSSKLCFCTTWENRKPENCVFSLKCCMLFTKNTRNTLKYHLLTAEPPFTVKMIDWMHRTGPRKGA